MLIVVQINTRKVEEELVPLIMVRDNWMKVVAFAEDFEAWEETERKEGNAQQSHG